MKGMVIARIRRGGSRLERVQPDVNDDRSNEESSRDTPNAGFGDELEKRVVGRFR
jgi:hypothetical protein